MDMCTNTAYLATISSLVVALITSVVVLTTAIVIILQRNKAKIKELQPPHRAASSSHLESMYEDPLPSVSAINTKENVAYAWPCNNIDSCHVIVLAEIGYFQYRSVIIIWHACGTIT